MSPSPAGLDRARSGGLVVLGFSLALFLPFLSKPLHNDEPVFAAIGRRILVDPLHPLGFDYYWFGQTLPMKKINTTPPAFHYLMALDQGLAGDREWVMRLLFLPFSLAAAWALYAIAGRFLERPLLPSLIVIACPAFLINMGHLMPEAPSLGLGLPGLWLAVKGADKGRDRDWLGGAALLGASVLFKYNAALLIPAALGFAALRGASRPKLAAFACLACAPAVLYLGWDLLGDRAFAARAWEVTSQSASGWWSSLSHKARSLLAFTGGCGLVTGLWPYWAEHRRGWAPWHLAAAAGVVALFLPVWDLAPVRSVDRLTGIVLSSGAVFGLTRVFLSAGKVAGWELWLPWLGCAVVFQAFLYWSVMARTVLHMLPPLVFALSAGTESLLGSRRFKHLALASLACVTALSLCLGWVDFSYAAASKSFAEEVSRTRLAKGQVVYFTGAMGLQHYLEPAGGRGLEVTKGGWDRVLPGEAVVVLRINSVRSGPSRPRLTDVRARTLGHPIPLRLMSGYEGDGGFYSNLSGFLPYSLSGEALEEFSVVEMR
ncbi:MAG: glycosyltransferase family 39 protein [Elusimicrobia bacterium]|nr:glycosyltransferase family 39 protein [Elusimicrobiota bacterium]